MSLVALAFALAFAADVPAWAASPPPALPDSLHRTMERYRYFANCTATRNWDQARGLFDTPIGSRAEQQALDRATGGSRGTECSYADYLRMTSMLMRGGIAESRYRHVYGQGAAPPANAEVAPAPADTTFTWVGFNRDSHPQALHGFAACLAGGETGAVHAVLMTGYGSREERAAFHALSRRFGACLRPGQRLQANPLTLRPWLAEAQYQLFRARRPDTD
jgi:hypothetical protein